MEIANIPAELLQRVNQNFFRRWNKCLRVEWQLLQHQLWSVNCNYFIRNVIGQQESWFIGKIRIRLAAGGAPVAVKRRVVNRSTKISCSTTGGYQIFTTRFEPEYKDSMFQIYYMMSQPKRINTD
jgi:hypothetical protein